MYVIAVERRSLALAALVGMCITRLLRSADRIRCWARNRRVLAVGMVRPNMAAASLTRKPPL